MKRFKLGVIGGGINSAVGRAHFCASRMDGNFEWHAGHFSRAKGVQEASMNAYGVGLSLVDENGKINLLTALECDAILVLTPTPDHAKTVKQLLSANIPVICEKSLATSTAELSTIPNRDTNFLAVMYNYTGYPMVREMRKLIENGSTGRILSFEADMPQEGYLRDGSKPQLWRLKDGAIPMLHLDLGVHLHHMIRYLIGSKPISMTADQRTCSKFGVIDSVNALVNYNNGMRGSMRFGKSSLGARNGLSISVHGEFGSLSWRQTDPENLYCATSTGVQRIIDRGDINCLECNQARYQRFKVGHPAGFIEAMANVYDDIASHLGDYYELKKGESFWVNPEVGDWRTSMEGLQLMEAMVESAETGLWTGLK